MDSFCPGYHKSYIQCSPLEAPHNLVFFGIITLFLPFFCIYYDFCLFTFILIDIQYHRVLAF